MLAKLIIPAITFITTYYEGIQGIFGAIPAFIERPFQAFAGAFLGGLALSVVGSVPITGSLVTNLAKIGAAAAVGSLIGATVGGLLGFGDVPMWAAIGAAAGVYMTEDLLTI